jgi:amino acid adenylation domain-containing protein
MARDAGVAQLIALDGLPVPDALARDLPSVFRPEAMAPEFRRDHAGRPNVPGDAGDIAYILYTSGSTGKPKGTLVGHAGYVNTVLSAGETFGLTRDDRTLMVASPSFDVSLSDIGIPLASGATLCPVPDDVLRQPSQFLALLTELRVTVADVTPTYLRLFGGADLPTLRILVTGGEAPFPADIRRYAGTLRYYNAYDPTENTITSTIGQLGPEDRGFLSCGRPLPNTSVAIRDNAGNPVPPGVMGEIWLGGVGLAHGYLNRQDLTAASFVQTPDGRRYRTGDLGRWRAGGELEVAGRIDDQVKLNGIRIELGEIEHALETHPGVGQAVVLIDGEAGGTQSLWAFVSPTPSPAPEADPLPKDGWRNHLAGHLPTYMIPASVIPVPAIPLTPSGKVDKSALKALQTDRPRRTERQHPLNATESAIARVWEQELRCGPVHQDDDFFTLGGHSLLAIAVAHRLETEFGHPVPARELFAEPTLAGFARRVGEIGAAGHPSGSTSETSSDRATEGEREFHVAEQAGLDTRGFHIALTLNVAGAVPSDDRWLEAWAALAARHDALRTRFHEDDSGVLRRIVQLESAGIFETGATPDRASALQGIRARQSEPFAMEAPPLWRAGLTRIDGDEGALLWLVLHHSIGDGLSLGVLVEELTTILLGQTLPVLEGSPARSAALAEAYLDSEACRDDADHWRGVLAGMPEAFDEWPLDFPRPAGRSAKAAKGTHTHRIRLDAATADALRRFAQRNGASLHALMLTVLAQEARRRTGRSEFLLGTAASTRETATEARVVGYYVNMLPVPCRPRRGEPVEQALAATQRALGDGLRRSRYPFARIYQDLRRDHPSAINPGRYPLFDLAVTENPAAGGNASAAFRFAAVETLTGEGVHYDLRPSGPAQDMRLFAN